MYNNFFDELSKRNLITHFTPGLKEHLQNSRTLYIGFDPTADSLHIGSLLPLLIAKRAINFGHKIIIILGGGTALIGDPSGKNKERPIISEAEIEKNKKAIEKQIRQILGKNNEWKIVDNARWLKNLPLIDFLREIGKEVSINTMMDLEFIKTRIERQEYLSFAEFSYQILQAYDFLNLFELENCTVQYGGSDQWGNIIQGVQLIKKKTKADAFGFSIPLITDPITGKKFGKTEKGKAIWLNPLKTKPFELYEFIFNLSDALTKQLLYYYSFKPLEQIEEIIKEQEKAPEKRLAQTALADEIANILYGEKTVAKIKKIKEALFKPQTNPQELFELLDEKIIEIYSAEKDTPIKEIIARTHLAESKKQASRLLDQKAVKIFKDKNILLIKRGKKNFAIVKIQNAK